MVYILWYIYDTYLSCTPIMIGVSGSLLRLLVPCHIKWFIIYPCEGDLRFYHDSLWIEEPKISLEIIKVGCNCQMLDERVLIGWKYVQSSICGFVTPMVVATWKFEIKFFGHRYGVTSSSSFAIVGDQVLGLRT